MKKIIATVGIALGVMLSTVCYAEVPELKGNFDFISGKLHIDGKISLAEKYITANMLVLGKTPQEAENETDIGSNIVFCGETVTDENGNFSFDAKLAQTLPEGEYNLYFGSEVFEGVENYPVYFSDANTYKSRINQLNEKIEYSDFKAWLDTDDGAKKIGFDEYASLSDKDTTAKMLYNYARSTGFSTTDGAKNSAVIASAYNASLIKNNGALGYDWIKDIYLTDHYMADLYDRYAVQNMSYFRRVINKNSETVEALEKSILDALILTVVKNPNGNDNIKTVFTKYASYLGAKTATATMNNYGAIAGREFFTVSDCVAAFNTEVDKASHTGSGSGGVSGGSSGSRGPKDSNDGIFIGANTNEKNELAIKFTDLNPVPWAYKSISVLYEKGIISGKSADSFCPNDTVTREEFVKMLVCAAGFENFITEGNAFADAEQGAWYTKYINIAYEKNICRGIEDGVFGVGRTIKREDM